MHFLLIPYSILVAIFIYAFQERREAQARTMVYSTASLTALMMFMAIFLRPVSGDSWRYYMNFLAIRDLKPFEAITVYNGEPLYVLLTWTIGQLGSQNLLLFGGTLATYFYFFILSIRNCVGKLGVAVLIICYSAYPYFVAYGASALRQGLALVFLLMAYVRFNNNKRSAWIWLLLSPYWHSSAWLAVAVAAAHYFLCRYVSNERIRWVFVFASLLVAIVLSFSALNALLMSHLPEFINLSSKHDIYFTSAEEIGYRAGFRLDFFLFSLVPLATGWYFRRSPTTFSYSGSGWWLSLYLSLNLIYHLFSFAPFADRFASFSWFLLPLVIYLQVRDTGRKKLISAFVIITGCINILMLQFYTGNFIGAPSEW